MQAIDELRHAQTQIHTISHYNKHFNGLHDPFYQFDRVWYLSVPKSLIRFKTPGLNGVKAQGCNDEF